MKGKIKGNHVMYTITDSDNIKECFGQVSGYVQNLSNFSIMIDIAMGNNPIDNYDSLLTRPLTIFTDLKGKF